jgi:hypothetical protein
MKHEGEKTYLQVSALFRLDNTADITDAVCQTLNGLLKLPQPRQFAH